MLSIDKINQLEKENRQLKAENEKLKALCDTYRTCYQAKHSDIKCLFIKYKQTLQEIKAIAEDAYENESEYQATGVYNEILQKITKAEEE